MVVSFQSLPTWSQRGPITGGSLTGAARMALILKAVVPTGERTLVGGIGNPSLGTPTARSLDTVTTGKEIREFLTSRRGRIMPDQAGLRAYSRRRRVSGLRREEVAMLAGISVEYYTQLERGNVRCVS